MLDDGFTLCVSAAVETTGWIHAQYVRRGGVSADGELLMLADGTQARARALCALRWEVGLPPSAAAICWPLDGQSIGVWRSPSIYTMSKMTGGEGEKGAGEEKDGEGGSPTFGRGVL